ncbi:MAG: PD40 domain-containing protein [Verrucomicrobiales bacterium]|nr:PD40 domain-containing protein [Verrucomicrobiales bacterium]
MERVLPRLRLRLRPRLLWAALATLAFFLCASTSPAQRSQGYHRYPALHGDTLVFTSEGDLWRVPVSGGLAQRLTTHPGTEANAALSPDGTTVAFSAEYEGPREVYTMPLAGGLPIRRTFLGGSARVVGWTHEARVLFSTEDFSGLPNTQLAALDPVSGAHDLVPLSQAAEGSYSPDGPTLFFTRLPWQGSSTKRYQGGTAQNLWRFAERDAEAVPLTADYRGTSKNPMWWKDRLYFLSDRDGIMNLWSMKADGSDLSQHTRHKELDIQSASLHEGRVAYQLGADLRWHDLATAEDRLVPITLTSDFDQLREKWVAKPMDYLSDARVSPKGDRIVLTARGQVFVVPVEQGRLVEIPRPAGVRYRSARFLPDGKSVLAFSDESGELEFWRLAADGLSPAVQLTTNGTVFRFPGTPSPDGSWIAFGDKDQKLWIHHVEKRETRLVASSSTGTLTDFSWSPDSQWLAYASEATNGYARLHLYRPDGEQRATLTSERVNSYDPAWSPDGKWLYFLSDRNLRSMVRAPWGHLQPEPYFVETTKIYQIALTSGLRSPFAPRDELNPEEAGEKAKDATPGTNAPVVADTNAVASASAGTNTLASGSGTPAHAAAVGAGSKPAVNPVVIELEGISERLFEVPVASGNFSELQVTPKHLFWASRDTSFEGKRHLKQMEITAKDPKPKTFAEDVQAFEFSADGKKIMVRKEDAFYVVAADAAAPVKLEEKINIGGWTLSVQPREEWRQIYTEAWRMMRDYFYDRGMHQVDWPAIRQKYLPLVDRVSDRGELSQVLSQMVGELSALHIFVRAGDERQGLDRVVPAQLGARLALDAAGGGWRVEHIHRADPDYPGEHSPLAKPGVGVKPGDVILSINGRSTLGVPDPSVLLRQQAGKQVLLEVRSRTDEKPRRTIVTPITPEQADELRYDEWELTRREQVEGMSAGRIGYVHLRAMGAENIAEWARHYYPVFQRQGLIIDVRHNRGGNIDSWILGKLLRKAWFYWQGRLGEPVWNMQYAFRGHLVVLCNEFTASDGEAFSEGFRRLGLGKVIGTRTWGGEIWLSAERWLVDRGMATAAETGVYGPEGAWLIEGHGVDPDVVVDNLPHATFRGTDSQLEAAVKHLQELIERDPRPVPPAPKYPDKSFRPK